MKSHSSTVTSFQVNRAPDTLFVPCFNFNILAGLEPSMLFCVRKVHRQSCQWVAFWSVIFLQSAAQTPNSLWCEEWLMRARCIFGHLFRSLERDTMLFQQTRVLQKHSHRFSTRLRRITAYHQLNICTSAVDIQVEEAMCATNVKEDLKRYCEGMGDEGQETGGAVPIPPREAMWDAHFVRRCHSLMCGPCVHW